MSEPVKIAIVLEGGVVSQVLSAGVHVEFVTIDYDDEADENGPDVVAVPQGDGSSALAYVSEPDLAQSCGEFVLEAHRRFGMAGSIA